MGFLLSLLSRLAGGSCQVPRVETDDIFPVHFIDQGGIIRTSIISYTFRYNDILHSQQLYDSLVKLLGMGEWRKLGGRLRRNKNGNLEIHVPREYTAERPAIRFSRAKFDSRIEEHSLGSLLPRKTENPSVQEGCHEFRSFSVPSDLPNNIEHYLSTDEPLMSLHITSFTNATLVSISFPHSVTDAMGTAELLKAWSSVLGETRVPVLLGARGDVIETVGTTSDQKSQVPHVLKEKQIKGLSLLVFAVRFAWDLLTRRNVRARTIFLPAKFISQLRQRAQAQLESSPFLSDGDLITAWGSHKVMLSRPRRPVVICNVFDLRSRLNGIFAPRGSYLQNLILPASAYLSSIETSTMSFGEIALRLRQAIVKQATNTQARSLMRAVRASYTATGLMPLFGSSDSIIIACTNWSKARFLEAVNFGPAVIFGDEKSTAQTGTCVSYWGTTIGKKDNPRDTFIIYGKDDEENYWIHAYLRSETWDLIEKEFS